MVKKHKIIIFIMILIFIFSVFQIGHTFATTESISLTNVEIVDKSDGVIVKGLNYENKTITNDFIFNKFGDFITYKITLKNNDNKDYIINKISDNNKNEYLTYEYDNYSGTQINSNEEKSFNIIMKYSAEINDMTQREQSISVNILFNFIDKDGNEKNENITFNQTTNSNDINKEENKDVIKAISNNPKTGDNILFYIITASISLIIIVFLIIKNNNKSTKNVKKVFSLFLVLAISVPIVSKAINEDLNLSIRGTIKLNDKLVISHEENGEIISETINYGDTLNKPEDPVKPGYTFNEWYLEDGTEYDFNTPVTEDISLNPKFEIIIYDITYNLNGGEASNQTTYTVEDEIKLNNPYKNGYIFNGWTGTGLVDKTENVIIDKGSTGSREYTANYIPVQYSISYELNGGIAVNPNSYTIEDEITLNKPTKEGYDFIGWTGTGLTNMVESVTISEGSIDNRIYTANWKPIDYTITYEGLTDDEKIYLNNPTTYNIETDSITLKNPENRMDKDGDEVERFVGWKENQTVSTNVIIPSELGDKVYEAIWVVVDPNIYTITYNLNDGTVENENRTSFTKLETFTLSNPSKRGYTFEGWTGSNGTIPQTTVTVSEGTRENLNYIANWIENTYTIAYNLNNGIVNPENPTTYTVNSNSITLNNPTKTGYTFIGWTGTDLTDKTLEVVIPTNSIENRTYTANYEANKYTIIFDRNTGLGTMPNQLLTYDQNENLNENTYTKTGYTFNGWNTKEDGTGNFYLDKQNVINLSTGENITLFAQWKPNAYFIDYHSNGGSGTQMQRQQIEYGEETTLMPNQYSNENLFFVGWNTKEDGTGTYYADEQQIQNLTSINGEIINLYAIWREMKVGDYVDYHPESGDGAGLLYKESYAPPGTSISGAFKSNESIRWRILKISDEGVTLVAEKPTIEKVKLTGAYGYINGIKLLNDISDIYGHGIGAKRARSIKLDDIEPNFKYDKTTFSTSGYSYGDTNTYNSGKFIVDNNIITASSSSPQTVTQTVHWYNVDNYAYSIDENETKNKIYNMLCVDIPITNRNGTNNLYSPYWLANKTQYITSRTQASFGLHYIGDIHNCGIAEMGNRALFSSVETVYNVENHVLPIVELKQSIKYTYNNNTGNWSINYTPVNYTVSFNSNGGTGEMADEEFELGEEKRLSKNTFVKEGFVFNGWNTQPDGNGINYGNEQVVYNLSSNNGDIINLYAMWIQLNVGDYVNYDSASGEGFNLEFDKSKLLAGTSIPGASTNNFKSKEIQRWRVFSTENGVIQLVAEQPTTQTLQITGNAGYRNCVEVLNEISKIYGKGIGASEGRSIALEDIESYFKYDKTLFKEIDTAHNLIVRYGDTKSYNSGVFLDGNEFVTASTSSPYTATQTAYWYNINSSTYYSVEENELAHKIYEMLCVDIPVSNGGSGVYTPFALANTSVYLRHDCTQNYVHYIGDLHGYGYPEMGGVWLSTSSGTTGLAELHILPIITLKSSVILSNAGTNSWNISVEN